MPKRTDIKKILIIGSGPIVIGQGCEFDYSGSQACKALREEGYKVVLINSNPATIMTDPEMADRTYIEPITPEFIEKVIKKERPEAVLPTLGGQTGLNTAVAAAEAGIFKRYGVEMIGANLKSIKKAEQRDLFKKAMQKIGLDLPRSGVATSLAQAKQLARRIGYPLTIRPSFTLGGSGGGFAHNDSELETIVRQGLALSLNHQVLVEESLVGWKEYEMEVMRDHSDNVVIICSIENFDPMGVHTGDSITVAPIQTLTDSEYQHMRDASIACIREIGVDTGGSNIQFAINPKTGRMVVIEMNPRVSRSSALASKATGFPIAKIAAKLAVGYRLDELSNDITRKTPASFEPTLDYCVVKVPRFTFEKFPTADDQLGTQMKSVGETMAIGRTFKEALQKALRGLETGVAGLESPKLNLQTSPDLAKPTPERIFLIKQALENGVSPQQISQRSGIDPWFIDNIAQIVELEHTLKAFAKSGADKSLRQLLKAEVALLRQAKQYGFSDAQLAEIFDVSEDKFRHTRCSLGVLPTYQLVDTCGGEFVAYTPYFYSTYESRSELKPSKQEKIIIIGGGPNRIGQGIEFDYCCCQAAFALKEIGYETIMINSNPETVSTDYDTSDRLFFEPVTFEDVMNIIEAEQPKGVIIQFGGQTPLNLAQRLQQAGVPIIGTSPASIAKAEDRRQFKAMLDKLGLRAPLSGAAHDLDDVQSLANSLGYPVLLRPSFVLGGRAMEIIYAADQLKNYLERSAGLISADKPVLVDEFLENAIEIDVDLISDGKQSVVAGIMQHIETAGIHSGDSTCVLPPPSLPQPVLVELKRQSKALARELNVVGLMNVQFAIKDGVVYVLEVNPRASRTIPFVSKAIGRPIAKLAAKAMAGRSLSSLGITKEITPVGYSVKEVVLPFIKFSGVDILLGPEMKSTGEVMGRDRRLENAYLKATLAAGLNLPKEGKIFISLGEKDKSQVQELGARLTKLGYELYATPGTAWLLRHAKIPVTALRKVYQGSPNSLDMISKGQLQLVINTPSGPQARADEIRIRSQAVAKGIPCFTSVEAAIIAVDSLQALHNNHIEVSPLQG